MLFLRECSIQAGFNRLMYCIDSLDICRYSNNYYGTLRAAWHTTCCVVRYVLHGTLRAAWYATCYTAHYVLHGTLRDTWHTACCTAHYVLHGTLRATRHTTCYTAHYVPHSTATQHDALPQLPGDSYELL